MSPIPEAPRPDGDPDHMTDRNVLIAGNKVFQAQTGMTLQRRASGARITANLLCDSRAANEGQLRIGAEIAGEIQGNTIENGAGHGIECLDGDYDKASLNFGGNVIKGNTQGRYRNCPETAQRPEGPIARGAQRCPPPEG